MLTAQRTITSMVALASNTSETSPWDVLDGFSKLHSRAREVKTRICTEAPYSKSLGRVEIWLTIYESCDGLESFTRDPIGYHDGASIYSSYLGLSEMDPSGEFVVGDITIPFLPPVNGISPCGSFSFDANANVTGIVPGRGVGAIAVKAAIILGLRKKFPIHYGAKVDCLIGRCCPIQTFILNLKIVFDGRPVTAPKYLATITIDTTTKLTIGVCLDAKCPCPIPLPDVTKNETITIPGEFPLEDK